MFGKLAEAQKKAEEVKQRLANITVDGKAGDGKVVVIADGNRKLKDIIIADELLKISGKKELIGFLTQAFENAMDNAENVSRSEMQSLMSSMMPGLGGMFGKKD